MHETDLRYFLKNKTKQKLQVFINIVEHLKSVGDGPEIVFHYAGSFLERDNVVIMYLGKVRSSEETFYYYVL